MHEKELGFTLIEAIVGTLVFMIVALAAYEGYVNILNVIRVARLKTVSTELANEQFEIIRNLTYSDVGILGGIPSGKIQRVQTLNRDNVDFTATTTIRSIDDPFDGTIGGIPNDLSPADYKLVELDISCVSCKYFIPLSFSTRVAPKSLETASNNGALFVQVFDANGVPVVGADVHIENNEENPAIIIDETTNNDGILQIVDAPPGVEAYEITVSKSGYSTERTYLSGAPENPNPIKPHAIVAVGQVTQISFAIDKFSTLAILSVMENCAPVPNIDFSLKGAKLIGASPDVLKYDEAQQTNTSGALTISNLEWDNYNMILIDASYDLRGAIPNFPLVINPNALYNLKIVVAPKMPNSLLVTVKDSGTQLPLTDASILLEKAGYSNTLVTGRGFLRQTDWSGGEGQIDFIDESKYLSSDGNIEILNPAGELKLRENFGQYVENGELISSTFDTGSASNFYQILWDPQDEPPQVGPDSVKFQLATNDDQTTWNFLGPDGTSNTYYTVANTNINSIHNGKRYFRYKVFLSTVDIAFTPNLAEVAFTFASSCVPPGQVLFINLLNGPYTLTISKVGYQTIVDAIDINSAFQERQVSLIPQ